MSIPFSYLMSRLRFLRSGSAARLAAAGALLLIALAFSAERAAAQRSTAALWITVTTQAGNPLSGATVVLPHLGVGGLTDSRGQVRLFGIPTNSYLVEARYLGYRTETALVSLRPGRMNEVVFSLEPEPIPLAEVRVRARRDAGRRMDFMRGFYERRERGIGYFLTREEIEEHGSSDLSNILRTVPGLRTSPTQFGQSRMRMARSHVTGTCRVRVYMDGMKYRLADDLPGIPTMDIEGIEIYRGRSEIPAEFADTEADCGVIVIWSRRHRPSQ